MKPYVLYIHGKNGTPTEADHYKSLFRDCEVIGLDYRAATPWEAEKEFGDAARAIRAKCDRLILIANSLGAYFSMCAGLDAFVEKAYFISPIVDMEQLIRDIMRFSNISESELQEKKVIPTAFGEDLSWAYLSYVRTHPVKWSAPTEILFGSEDKLTSFETVSAFAATHGARLTVMQGGEHWFHTAAQMDFLDDAILRFFKD